jgi:hypothetical protein
MRSTLVTLSLLILEVLSSHGQITKRPALDGRIVGTVIDVDGRPVPKVWVSASDFLPAPDTLEPVPSTQPISYKNTLKPQYLKWLTEDISWSVEDLGAMTNGNGEFEIKGLALRAYALKGENDEYFSSPLRFTDGSPAEVTLTSEMPASRVVLKLGSKGGIVAGLVRDKRMVTSLDAGFSLFRADDNSQFLAASARSSFRFVVPAGIGLTLAVSAQGYKPLALPLHLEPGEQRVLSLDLEADPTKSSTDQ